MLNVSQYNENIKLMQLNVLTPSDIDNDVK